jgi:hypothetical protein
MAEIATNSDAWWRWPWRRRRKDDGGKIRNPFGSKDTKIFWDENPKDTKTFLIGSKRYESLFGSKDTKTFLNENPKDTKTFLDPKDTKTLRIQKPLQHPNHYEAPPPPCMVSTVVAPPPTTNSPTPVILIRTMIAIAS